MFKPTLNDWNECLMAAKKLAKEAGICYESYAISGGDMGIRFFVTDIDRKSFGEGYNTGVTSAYNCKEEFILAIHRAVANVEESFGLTHKAASDTVGTNPAAPDRQMSDIAEPGKTKFIVSYNTEYNSFAIEAGPLDKEDAEQKMKEFVTHRIFELGMADSLEHACRIYDQADDPDSGEFTRFSNGDACITFAGGENEEIFGITDHLLSGYQITTAKTM